MSTDWYRNETWTPEISAEFDRRLARARAHNRPEYLRVQGVHLQQAGHIEAARELWVRVLDQPLDSFFSSIPQPPPAEPLQQPHLAWMQPDVSFLYNRHS